MILAATLASLTIGVLGSRSGPESADAQAIPNALYFSIAEGDTVQGIAIRNEDIVYFDGANFSLYFDGSDVGISSLTIDAFDLFEMGPDFMPDGPIVMSFTQPAEIPGAGAVDDSDLVLFAPTSLGQNTAGSFSLYFDGSDIGLTDDGEDIDAIDVQEDAHEETIFISTTGSFSITATFTPGGVQPFTGNDEDVLACVTATTGENSHCLGAILAIDGSEHGLTSDGEDVDAFAVGDIIETTDHFSTTGSFSVPGLSGPNEDVFACSAITSCTTFSRYFEGDAHTIAGNITGIDVPYRGSADE